MSLITNGFKTISSRGLLVFLSASLNYAKAMFFKKVRKERFIQHKVNNYKMLLDTTDPGISRSLILFGTREVDHKVILEEVLKPGITVFDIGANIGYYALMEKQLIGDKGKLIAIEPSPTNVKLLKRNLLLNGYKENEIAVVQCGVSNKAAEMDFHLAQQANLHTFHPKGSAARDLTGEIIKVKTYTIPDLVETHGAPGLIRMDVEGHELEIISGMLNDIEADKYKPMICFEPHLSCYTADHDFAPVLERLFKNGYKTPYLSSNAQSGTDRIKSYGYQPSSLIKSDGETKAIFENIKPDDVIKILTETGGARTVLLAP